MCDATYLSYYVLCELVATCMYVCTYATASVSEKVYLGTSQFILAHHRVLKVQLALMEVMEYQEIKVTREKSV